MTINSVNHLLDAEEAAPQGNGRTTKHDAETLQRRREELDDFVTQTRVRLRLLSKTLSQRPNEAATEEAGEVADSCVLPAPTRSEIELPRLVASESDAPAESSQRSGCDLDPLSESVDPLDRLSAIKLRLARQLEDA